MSAHQVFILALIQLAILLLPAYGLAKLLGKAGIPGWKAFIPFYNTWVMLQLGRRRGHWVFWQFIPIVGWFVSMSIFVEFVKLFGKFKFYEHALAALLPVFYLPYLGLDPKVRFLGPEVVLRHKKGTVREWVDAAVFAVVAATLIRTFVFEAYEIPTGSMEKSLLTGDYLFVSKMSYGPRIPMTPLAIPFVHNSLPVTNWKSYLTWIRLPYIRWWASPIKRGDAVVFNWPIGDTVINLPDYQSARPYYDVCRELGGGNIDAGRSIVLQNPDEYPLAIHPVDKEENYIKRCEAIAGDTLEIRDEVVYINGKAQPFPPESETYYIVTTKGQPLDDQAMKEDYDVDMNEGEEFMPAGAVGPAMASATASGGSAGVTGSTAGSATASAGVTGGAGATNGASAVTGGATNQYRMLLTRAAHDKMLQNGLAVSMTPEIDSNHYVFPYSVLIRWSQDNYGPIFIPHRGAVITLAPENYALYERAIRIYEGNDFYLRDGKYFLNGQEVTQYTFRMDYYWMMGDNRHGSQDSRYWGLVPEDHIVGKPELVWMSWSKGVRWGRLFKKIR
jgi:signal peptidase I